AVTGTAVSVQAWGKLKPTDIDWGKASPAYAYAPGVGSDLAAEAVAVNAFWATGWSETLMAIRPVEEGRLRADVYTRFTDGSGRTSYAQSYIFGRGVRYRCPEALPVPKLELVGTEEYEVGEEIFTRYRLSVANWESYPPELFEPSPDLPPCGLNAESSRTWIDIFNQDGVRIYGFCALAASEELADLWFAVKLGESPPDLIYVVMTDRCCDISASSNEVSIASSAKMEADSAPSTATPIPPRLQTMISLQRGRFI
ncbi:MAG: hypothetical protein WBK88_03035, partial [Methanothrix sp.]